MVTNNINTTNGLGNINPEGSEMNYDNAISGGRIAGTVKNISNLIPGETFMAEILDIRAGSLTLKLDSGNLTAKSLVIPDARIGDRAVFLVKENQSGQVILEFLKQNPKNSQSQVSESIIKEALAAARMQHTVQNSEIVIDLVKHNMSIDSKTIQNAAFFRYSLPQIPFEQIAFLLKHDFPPIQRTIETYSKISSGNLNLLDEMH
ncbi:MAG: hypothetical protein FWD01_04270, partial [Defluviitaleaceae bacterium]|nr:hypothetical protein [Defluviitaleaceae bacterium]